MSDASSKRPSRQHPRWIQASAWVALLVSPLMFFILVMPFACHALDVRASLRAESVQAETHESCVSAAHAEAACDLCAPGGCFDDRDLDLAVVEVAAAGFDFPLPGILAIVPLPALNPIALVIRRDSDRRAPPSLALYERTSRLRN